MATTQTATVGATAKAPAKTRKRAPKACLSCRARKVRCDVSQRGRPCMNCYLDSESCVVTGRASRLRPPPEDAGKTQSSYPPHQGDETHQHAADTAATHHVNPPVVRDDGKGLHEHSTASRDLASRELAGLVDDSSPEAIGEASQPKSIENHGSCHHDHQPPKTSHTNNPAATSTKGAFANTFSVSNSFNPLPATQWTSTSEQPQKSILTSDVTYSYYPFLAIGNIHYIPPQDVNFLELQGCLRMPTRAILDEFVQQYFLHVHPMLPLLNEGDFWDMYCNGGSKSLQQERISLLVFQAMLFSTANFVSRQSIKALGYATIRAARASFYRRAKLLYDLETESSPLSIAQAALLLTHWSAPASHSFRKPNTQWLAIAIQNAKTAEAHHYDAAPTHIQNTLKRLWWCCITRDRIMGLGIRRPLHITRAHFDFDKNSILGYADLSDEIERSRVYNPGTKRCLAEILEQLVELCVVLTDILILVFPIDDSPGWGRELKTEEQDKLREYKIDLRRWYKSATLRFPMFGGGSVARMNAGGGGKEFQHDSVILYTNLMYMYYHSSRVVLSHHEVLHLAIAAAAPSFSSIPSRDLAIIGENRHELQDAASGVTECLKELIHLRLARWLPISAVACTALPLVLHILDVKLSSSAQRSSGSSAIDPNTQSALKQHRLNILIEAMKTYQPQYDGVDLVSETIRHIVNLAQIDPPADGANNQADGSAISDWTDILASQPSSYLRLALTMDLALSKGRLPEDGDFPVSLRGLFTGGFNALRTLIEQKRSEAATAAAAAAAMAQNHAFSHASALHAVDFDAGTLRPSLFHLQPGVVTAVHSDEDTSTTSPASAGDHSVESTTDATSPHQVYDLAMDIDMMGGGGGDDMSSDGIAGLAAEVMAAFPLHGVSPSSGGDFDGMYFDGSEPRGEAAEWMDGAWAEMAAGEEERTDRDTARALLEALKQGEVGDVVL
ncbi:hypothetical protein VD0004_g3339 [Verticillium dahliae]|uniref:Zn(2)-C6 fungal-type domain-containing protein n=1 Tax=Verticillium dahliae TaxID=27337 RepID=A0A444RQN2_VERDA|nr:hypothetical protein VD0004_g3339 [Verticillium dahliae]PNH69848.1 hypothetical protein VD0001_g7057 [Verticillium dahliae]RXG43541.1 hypothetical protein VDGE_01129 [Verticillium dahliae]